MTDEKTEYTSNNPPSEEELLLQERRAMSAKDAQRLRKDKPNWSVNEKPKEKRSS